MNPSSKQRRRSRASRKSESDLFRPTYFANVAEELFGWKGMQKNWLYVIPKNNKLIFLKSWIQCLWQWNAVLVISIVCAKGKIDFEITLIIMKQTNHSKANHCWKNLSWCFFLHKFLFAHVEWVGENLKNHWCVNINL